MLDLNLNCYTDDTLLYISASDHPLALALGGSDCFIVKE